MLHTPSPAAALTCQPPSGSACAPNEARRQASHRYGPFITHRMDGAGGPHNEWDAKIAAAHRRGNPQLAKRLLGARARINLTFQILEPVWIPTDHQRVMLALRAGTTGLRVMDAAVQL
jgi:hypothetical protein